MDRFMNIKEKLLALAKDDEDIKAIVLIGSSTRDTVKADEYSDLDVVIATEKPEGWLYGDCPKKLGSVKISFVEPTLGGGKERRMLYDGSLDVDMIVFTPEQFKKAIREGVASWVMNRGYEILYDAEGFSTLLEEHISHELKPTDLAEPEFNNMVNDILYNSDTKMIHSEVAEEIRKCSSVNDLISFSKDLTLTDDMQELKIAKGIDKFAEGILEKSYDMIRNL